MCPAGIPGCCSPGIDPGQAGQGHTKGRALLPSAAPIIDRERFLRIKGRVKDLGWGFLPALFSHRGCFLLKFQSGRVRFPEWKPEAGISVLSEITHGTTALKSQLRAGRGGKKNPKKPKNTKGCSRRFPAGKGFTSAICRHLHGPAARSCPELWIPQKPRGFFGTQTSERFPLMGAGGRS